MTPFDVIRRIEAGFAATPRLAAAFLAGSREGCEPAEVTSPFAPFERWQDVPPALLDENAEALSFFSEGAFRFFLPAFLVADLNGVLERADPLFHLVGPFATTTVNAPVADETFVRHIGGSTLLNPRRYGALTFEDYGRFRLAVFTREEAEAIVAYLDHRRQTADRAEQDRIGAALDRFWRGRATGAPTGDAVARFLDEESRYQRALERKFGDATS